MIDLLCEGQVWTFHTRPDEPDARVHIGPIEDDPRIGQIVHIKLTGLRIANPLAPEGFTSVMSHAPVARADLEASLVRLTDAVADLAGLAEGYAAWRAAYDEGEAGVFTISLAEIADVMAQALGAQGAED